MVSKVKGTGAKPAKIMIVGEAPGEEEAMASMPFVGAAGRLLHTLMKSVGINRFDCYITNVVKERPPANNIAKFIDFKKNGAIHTQEYDAYEEELRAEIEEVNPNVVVACGKVALYALTRRTEIIKLRGSILEGLGGRKVIPIIHPAKALREYMFTYFIIFDLKKIKEQSLFPEIILPSRNLMIAPSFHEAECYLHQCKQAKRVCIDIEVLFDDICCMAFALAADNCMSIPFVKGSMESYFTEQEEVTLWQLIKDIMEDPQITKVGQNLVFDCTYLLRRLGIETRGPTRDTMIAHGILYPDLPKGLDFLTASYTNEPYYKDEGKKWKNFESVKDEALWRYNAKDASVTMELIDKLEHMIIEELGAKCYDIYLSQTSLVRPLVFMQERGMLVNREGKNAASIAAIKRIETLQSLLNNMAGQELNVSSPKQMKEFFYIHKRMKPRYSRQTGELTVDATALTKMASEGVAEAKIILEMKKIKTLKSNFLDMVLDSGRAKCSFNPVGTPTGRLSSSKTEFDTGRNIQNLPLAFRKFIIPDPDYIMYSIDLSQAENRVVAYYAPIPQLISAFEEGVDVHKKTAALIHRKQIEEISDEAGSSCFGRGIYSERAVGKTSNFSFNYGMSAESFAQRYNISSADAKYIRDAYITSYPGLQKYWGYVDLRIQKDRRLENLFGRSRIFLDRHSAQMNRAGYDWIAQSTVADIINIRGILFIQDKIDIGGEPFTKIEMLNQVHDSIVFQLPVSNLDEHAYIINSICESLEAPIKSPHNAMFVIPADASVGVTLGHTCKIKKIDGKVTSDEIANALSKSVEIKATDRELILNDIELD